MKASVAFVLLAFLSATTAKVHVQNRKASKVIEDPDEANNFLKRASACIPCPITGVRCCLPSVCRPTDGKCSNNPVEGRVYLSVQMRSKKAYRKKCHLSVQKRPQKGEGNNCLSVQKKLKKK